MYATLYQYLIQHKKLSVPGIGTFLLHRKPAAIDFPNKKINPPAYYITLLFPASAAETSFFAWLANTLKITDREAVVQFNDFAFDMKKKIINGDSINWTGVGIFKKGLTGEVKFSPEEKEIILEKPLSAEKVLRENAEHTIRVGEEERTSSQMTRWFLPAEQGEKKSSWWLMALLTGLIAFIFLGWYFSEHGLTIASTGNTDKSVPAESLSTYQIIP